MHDHDIKPEYTITFRHLVITLLLSTCLVACTTFFSKHEWDKSSLGPVIPHDTFPADCSICHVAGGWHDIKADFEFDHEKETGVALAGAHEQAACLLCHNDRGDVATFASRGCAGCHEDNHQGNLGNLCSDCHNEQSWRPKDAIAQHNRTRLPLIGAHASAACFTCHKGAQVGNFEGLDVSCESCHTKDLSRAIAPDHMSQGLTTDCQRCHIPTTWKSARFAHPSSFPLNGAHKPLDCSVCHGEGAYNPLPTDCASCHLQDYQNATLPNHVAAGFDTECQQCHNTTTWIGAKFNHTSWPLTGSHKSASCSSCHGGNVYSGTPTDCFTCHQTKYQETTDPNHIISGFGTSCQTCHNTTTWSGAVFNHSFPINSGAHVVLDCADCHTVPSSPTQFSCTHCHEHSQAEMLDDHSEVAGYTWSSPSCLQCHPDGRD